MKIGSKESFVKKVWVLMDEKHLTLTDLSEQSGVDMETLKLFLSLDNRLRYMGADLVFQIAKALNVTMEYLLADGKKGKGIFVDDYWEDTEEDE